MVMVMGFMFILSASSAAFISLSSNEMALTQRQNDATRTFYTGQAGLEQAIAGIRSLYALGNPPFIDADFDPIQAPALAGYTFDNFDISFSGASTQGPIQTGPLTGMQATLRPITITVQATSQTSGATTELIQTMQSQFITLFQFGIFYYEDLELLPGPNMTFSGPVHSNKDIYVGAGNNSTLSFDSTVTTTSNFYHGRKDGSNPLSQTGVVQFKDAVGIYQDTSIAPDSGGRTRLDSLHDDWILESQSRWDGLVRGQDHGVSDIELAFWPNSIPPHQIIERGDAGDSTEVKAAKFYYKADVRIIDGVAYDKDGNIIDLTYPDPDNPGETINPISTETFYNYREGTNVQVTEVDIAKMVQGAKTPANGVLYVSDSRGGGSGYQDGVRLVNGSTLPSGGLTVVSDNPMYIRGDYNTVSKKPAAVINDALTILSNSWNDANSNQSLNNRVASNTLINAAVMTGNTDTVAGGAYNGGVENLPRFLEKWSGKTLTYRGSIVDLWNSVTATGAWSYGSPQYTAPVRDWGYDTDFSDPAFQPPGIPFVYNIQRVQWQYDFD